VGHAASETIGAGWFGHCFGLGRAVFAAQVDGSFPRTSIGFTGGEGFRFFLSVLRLT